jgi:hypothetical protein
MLPSLQNMDWHSQYKKDPKAVQALAQDPSTPANVLAEIADSCEELASTLVQNPNMPLDPLEQLSRLSPKEFLQNPLLLLLLVDEPRRLAMFASAQVCAEPEAPDYLLASAYEYTAKLFVALHPNTPTDTLLQYVYYEAPDLQRSAAYSLLQRIPIEWKALAQCPSEHIRKLVAQHPYCPAPILAQLTSSPLVTNKRKAIKMNLLPATGLQRLQDARAMFLSPFMPQENDPYCCPFCDGWEWEYLLEEDNSIHPLDLRQGRMHRRQHPKSDPERRRRRLQKRAA